MCNTPTFQFVCLILSVSSNQWTRNFIWKNGEKLFIFQHQKIVFGPYAKFFQTFRTIARKTKQFYGNVWMVTSPYPRWLPYYRKLTLHEINANFKIRVNFLLTLISASLIKWRVNSCDHKKISTTFAPNSRYTPERKKHCFIRVESAGIMDTSCEERSKWLDSFA